MISKTIAEKLEEMGAFASNMDILVLLVIIPSDRKGEGIALCHPFPSTICFKRLTTIGRSRLRAFWLSRRTMKNCLGLERPPFPSHSVCLWDGIGWQKTRNFAVLPLTMPFADCTVSMLNLIVPAKSREE